MTTASARGLRNADFLYLGLYHTTFIYYLLHDFSIKGMRPVKYLAALLLHRPPPRILVQQLPLLTVLHQPLLIFKRSFLTSNMTDHPTLVRPPPIDPSKSAIENVLELTELGAIAPVCLFHPTRSLCEHTC